MGISRWWRARWYGGRLDFGFEPGYPPFSLRQSRYFALAEEVASFVDARPRSHEKPVDLLDVLKIRGFRIASEGVLAPLEHLRAWWWLNQRIGEWAPSLCTEIQVVATKHCG